MFRLDVNRQAIVQCSEIMRFTDNVVKEAVFLLPCCIAAGCSPEKLKMLNINDFYLSFDLK